MKLLLLLTIIYTNHFVFSQNELTSKEIRNKKTTTDALDSSKFSPLVFNGQLSNNIANSYLALDFAEEKIKLQGVAFRSQKGFVGTVNISGENENNTLDVLKGTKVNPKLKGGFWLTIPGSSWLGYDKKALDQVELDSLVSPDYNVYRKEVMDDYKNMVLFIRDSTSKLLSMGDSANVDPNSYMKHALYLLEQSSDTTNLLKRKYNLLKYEALLKHPDLIDFKRKNYFFTTLGLELEGAQYNLYHFAKNAEIERQRKNYLGWSTFFQLNLLNYNIKAKRMVVHSLKAETGLVNNIENLFAYSYTETINSSVSTSALEKQSNGYVGNYFEQKMANFGYEVNFFPMDSIKRQLGLLVGTGFAYRVDSPNIIGLHVGVHFPVLRKANKMPLYISAIVSSNSEDYKMTKLDYDFKETLSFRLRIAAPITLSFLNK